MNEFEQVLRDGKDFHEDAQKMLEELDVEGLLAFNQIRVDTLNKFSEFRYVAEISCADIYQDFSHVLDQDISKVDVQSMSEQNFRTLCQITHKVLITNVKRINNVSSLLIPNPDKEPIDLNEKVEFLTKENSAL